MRIFALLMALCAAACVAPSAPVSYPNGHPVTLMKIALCGWSAHDLPTIHAAMAHLREANIQVEESMDCASDAATRGVLTVTAQDLNDHTGECFVLGGFSPEDYTIVFDPCVNGESNRRAVFTHEMLHAAAGQHRAVAHICRFEGELPDENHLFESCNPVGYGIAVLNPYAYGCHSNPLDPSHKFDPCIGQENPTDLDRLAVSQELQRRPNPLECIARR